MKKETSFCSWFDIDNLDHLKAYDHLQKYGMWPDGFVPREKCMETGWQAILVFRMASAWVEYCIKRKQCIEASKSWLKAE